MADGYMKPSRRDRGWMVVDVIAIDGAEGRRVYRYEVKLLKHKKHSSVYWILKGNGVTHFCDEYCEFKDIGQYLIVGIHGTYRSGEDLDADDREDWYVGAVVQVTDKPELEITALINDTEYPRGRD